MTFLEKLELFEEVFRLKGRGGSGEIRFVGGSAVDSLSSDCMRDVPQGETPPPFAIITGYTTSDTGRWIEMSTVGRGVSYDAALDDALNQLAAKAFERATGIVEAIENYQQKLAFERSIIERLKAAR